jgi:meso-butanediol dehydrogenase/(S,S)-butanediol dehydrogenase/diacetyl reductase
MSTLNVVVITGASSGLGKLIREKLHFEGKNYVTLDISHETGYDVRDEASVMKAAKQIDEFITRSNGDYELTHLINCAGVNHIEFIPKLQESDWDRIMNTNAKGIFLMAKHFANIMHGGTILNIVSNASHIPMTSSLAYNCSKAAALMATKQMSRELIKTHGITVFSISPNKLSGTGMSEYIDKKVCELRGWSLEEARAYQLASLPAGEETDPETLAEFIAYLLSSKKRHKYFAGCDIPYGL